MSSECGCSARGACPERLTEWKESNGRLACEGQSGSAELISVEFQHP